MANRETMYEEINMSLTHFGDALLDDGFLPDHCTSHLMQIVTDKDVAKRYADKSRKTLPVVNALYNIYANRATEHEPARAARIHDPPDRRLCRCLRRGSGRGAGTRGNGG